jgi:hypothetical protein
VGYKADLRIEVNKALSTGQLHRIQPFEQPQQQQNQLYQMNENEFLPVQQSTNSHPAPWMLTQTRQPTTDHSADINQNLLVMNEQLMEMMQNSKRVEEKLDQFYANLKQVARDTELHQSILDELLNTFTSMLDELFWPLAMANKSLVEKKPLLMKLCSQMAQLRPRLLKDYTARGERSSPPPLSLTTTTTTTKQNILNNGKENDIEQQ